jgi:hypothetical protein
LRDFNKARKLATFKIIFGSQKVAGTVLGLLAAFPKFVGEFLAVVQQPRTS